ncbi:MAG: AAA family ATPase, partial [Bacteroidetes bacterium]|nr:AAA family ATPase [Bacteroidota bacterium]
MIGSNEPLAERMRPRSLDEFIGQKHLVGPDKVIRKMLLTGRISSMILWGPPGSGKTTLANIISEELKVSFFSLSAISAGVKDIRQVIQTAKMSGNAILFIDEIHRFSKSQQESLLAAVEKGLLTLIGA